MLGGPASDGGAGNRIGPDEVLQVAGFGELPEPVVGALAGAVGPEPLVQEVERLDAAICQQLDDLHVA